MDLKHFGDSYDIVKKSLLQWLAPFGPWGAHPMFSHPVSEIEAESFSRFLAVPLTSTAVISLASDRPNYFRESGNCRSIFLDPNTGVRLHRGESRRATEFVFSDEVVEMARTKSKGLVLVFDQSLARGSEREQVRAKLASFSEQGIDGFAYISHASFLILGQSSELVRDARSAVLISSGLPEARIVSRPEF